MNPGPAALAIKAKTISKTSSIVFCLTFSDWGTMLAKFYLNFIPPSELIWLTCCILLICCHLLTLHLYFNDYLNTSQSKHLNVEFCVSFGQQNCFVVLVHFRQAQAVLMKLKTSFVPPYWEMLFKTSAKVASVRCWLRNYLMEYLIWSLPI